jgi:5,10-methylenetetrahydrofolate reductase
MQLTLSGKKCVIQHFLLRGTTPLDWLYEKAQLRLYRFIRQEHGDYFGISVAGYPEGHIDWYQNSPEISKEDYWKDMQV